MWYTWTELLHGMPRKQVRSEDVLSRPRSRAWVTAGWRMSSAHDGQGPHACGAEEPLVGVVGAIHRVERIFDGAYDRHGTRKANKCICDRMDKEPAGVKHILVFELLGEPGFQQQVVENP